MRGNDDAKQKQSSCWNLESRTFYKAVKDNKYPTQNSEKFE